MAYPAEAAPNPSTRDPARGREGGRVEMAYPAEAAANPSTRGCASECGCERGAARVEPGCRATPKLVV
jgi:hypothetical protein